MTALLALFAGGCRSAYTPHQKDSSLLTWTPVDSLRGELPRGAGVFSGQSRLLPLRAWLLHLPPHVRVEARLAPDPAELRSPTSAFVGRAGACAALNGGYFDMSAVPARHVGLLVISGQVVAAPTDPQVRAAVGWDRDGTLAFGWATAHAGSLRLLDTPVTDTRQASVWEPHHALAAGPMLVRDGRPYVTAAEEGFDQTAIPGVHPRSALGRTADGSLLLLVVDGRQPQSRGVSLSELARILLEAGAVDALNLDGGGSSTLVVGATRLNLPTGYDVEREVMSALVARCDG